ncbi:hypothetical protein LLH00_10630 [bacterium]|nr:hypothetical protein [bacterium]
MWFFVGSLLILLAGGVLSLCLSGSGLRASRAGAWSAVAGSLLGLVSALAGLGPRTGWDLNLPWSVQGGSLHLGMDPLSAFFLLALFSLSGLAALYGEEYLENHVRPGSEGAAWLFFNGLTASMAVVLTARNALLFLVAWEIMAITSFFLVSQEHEQGRVRQAGWIYLVATHLGTAFLLVFFLLLGSRAGSLEFADFAGPASQGAAAGGLLFLLALVGFGSKAGIVPFHVWLPEAHPAAPSHVSALMSGVMIKTGVYGLVRTLVFLGPPPAWWGWLLVGVGISSGLFGVISALAQHDLKRLLAFSSVENIGIIFLGLGLGELGRYAGSVPLAVAGFGGALLHVLNHSVFKGLLFLDAGAVLRAAGKKSLDSLGGLYKRMPWTGFSFLVGSVAISGLPPLNGFVGEFLIYQACLRGVIQPLRPLSIPALAVIGTLALIGGLAAAVFTKAFGIVFLGEPRSESCSKAHDPGWRMRLPQIILSALCLGLGLLAPWLLLCLGPLLALLTGLPAESVDSSLAASASTLMYVSAAGAGLLILAAGIYLFRRGLLARRTVGEAGTWDCGYIAPDPRMQYTAASFSRPLANLFRQIVPAETHRDTPGELFPRRGKLVSTAVDFFRKYLYDPVFRGIARVADSFLRLQHGNIHIYVLYIAVTLLALLIWKLGVGL